MLTPASDDPNRKAELKRKADHPHEFGTPKLDVKEVKERKLEGYKLATPKDGPQEPQKPQTDADADAETEEQRLAREAAEKAAAETRAAWEDYLDQPVNVLVGELSAVQDVEQLVAMQAVEAETKNRKTLIEAIVAEITKRGE